MPIQVQGPDGQEYEFPDGTSRETMKAAMAKRYGGPAAPGGGTPNGPWTRYQKGGSKFVQDATDFYPLLERLQVRAQASAGYRILATVGLLAGGFLLPGAAGMASFCLAAVAGLATVAALADFVARSLLMDVVTLQEVIRPRNEPADLLAYQLAQLLASDAASDEQGAH